MSAAFSHGNLPSIERIRDAAQILKAVAHPLRLRILLLLRQKRVMTVQEIQNAVEAPQPTVSQHLAVLRRIGVVADERRANRVVYRIKNTNLFKLLDCVGRLTKGEAS